MKAVVQHRYGGVEQLGIADIEAPSPGMDTPAYTTFGRPGFRMPYTRLHRTAA